MHPGAGGRPRETSQPPHPDRLPGGNHQLLFYTGALSKLIGNHQPFFDTDALSTLIPERYQIVFERYQMDLIPERYQIVFDLYGRSPESGSFWYTQGSRKRRYAPPLRAGGREDAREKLLNLRTQIGSRGVPTRPRSASKSSLICMGIRRRAVQIKAIEKEGLLVLRGMEDAREKLFNLRTQIGSRGVTTRLFLIPE